MNNGEKPIASATRLFLSLLTTITLEDRRQRSITPSSRHAHLRRRVGRAVAARRWAGEVIRSSSVSRRAALWRHRWPTSTATFTSCTRADGQPCSPVLGPVCAGRDISGIRPARGTTASPYRPERRWKGLPIQTLDIVGEPMQRDSGITLRGAESGGRRRGAQQPADTVQSDLLDTRVIRPCVTETTALGAAAYLLGSWPAVEWVGQHRGC